MLKLLNARKPDRDTFLRLECKKMKAILTGSTSLILKSAEAADSVTAGIANRLDFSRSSTHGPNRHLMALVTMALQCEAQLVDVEGSIMGEMFAPADMVRYDRGAFVLTDLTSDAGLLREKEVRLRNTCLALKAAFPDDLFEYEAVVFEVAEPITVAANPKVDYLSDFERFHFEYVDTLGTVERDDSELGDAVYRRRMEAPLETINRTKERALHAVEIAQGETDPEKVKEFLDTLTSYPESVNYLRRLFSTEGEFVRGFVGLTGESEEITTDDGEAGFFLSVKNSPEGTVLMMGVGGMILKPDGDLSSLVLTATHIGGGFFTMKADASCPQRFADLVHRKGGGHQERRTDTVMETGDAALAYHVAEEELREYEQKEKVQGPDLLDRAAKVLGASPVTSGGSKFVRDAAIHSLNLTASTAASSLFSMARLIHSLSLVATHRTRPNLFHVATAAGGKVLQVTKCTGPLETSNDTSCITYASGPSEVRGTWYGFMDGTIAVSKTLMIRADTTRWLSEAPGTVAAIVASYQEGMMDPTGANKSYVVSANLLALTNVKTLNVCIQMERQYVVGTISLANELDALVSKLSICNPKTTFEKILLFRLVLRGLACAACRDMATLRDSVVQGPDGRKTSIFCPVLASHGLMSLPGLINTFYDGTLSTGTSASKTRAVGVATMALFEGSEVYEGRKALNSPLAWMASLKTVQAWKEGRLPAFIASPDFIREETEHALSLVRKKFCCNLAMKYYEARLCRPDANVEDYAYKASQMSMASTMTLKKGLDDTKLTEDKSAFPSFITNIKPFVQKFVGEDREVTSATISFLESSKGADKLASVGSSAARAFASRAGLIGYATDKSDSIEKPRDIVFLNSSGRALQKYVDSIGYDYATRMGRSALKEANKIPVIQDMKRAVHTEGGVILSIMTDRSSYGPSVVAAGFYATYVGLGVKGELRDMLKFTFSNLTTKRVRLHDMLMAEDADLFALPGLATLVARAKRSADWTLPVPMGMFQGIFQGTADLASSVTHAYEERCLLKAFTKAKATGTNDDGYAAVQVGSVNVWESSVRIFTIMLMCSHAMGEALNTTKTVISSTISDLNTQLIINDQPFLPYVRSVACSAKASADMSVVSSALSVISSTNQAFKEGAPAFMLVMMLAIGWAVHYEKFRSIEEAVRGEYYSSDPLFLGPPVFEPAATMLAGPWATSIAAQNLQESEVRARANARVASVCSPGVADTVMTSWAKPLFSEEPFSGPCSYDFVMKTCKVRREAKEEVFTRGEPISAKMIDRGLVGGRLSVSAVVQHAQALASEMTRVSPFDTTCSLVANASAHYAIENQRIVMVSTSVQDLGKVGIRETFTIPELKGKIASMVWPASETPFPRAAAAYMELVGTARSVMEAMRMHSKYMRTPASRAMVGKTAGVEEFAQRDVMYLAGLVAAPDIASSVRLYAAMSGVIQPEETQLIDTATVAQVLEAVEGAKKLFRDMSPRVVPAMIVPEKAKRKGTVDRVMASYFMNVGYGFGMTSGPAISGGIEPGSIFTTRNSPEALEAMEKAMVFQMGTSEPALSKHTVLSVPITAMELGSHVPMLQDFSPGMLSKLSESHVQVSFTSELLAALHRKKVPTVMRRGDYDVAAAAEKKMVLWDARGSEVPYLGVRKRTTHGTTYRHEIMVLIKEMPSSWTRGEKHGEIRDRDFEIGDMKVQLVMGFRPVWFEVNYFPPACCMVADTTAGRLTIPIMEKDSGLEATSDLHATAETDDYTVDRDLTDAAAAVLARFEGDAAFHAMIATRAISNGKRDSLAAFAGELLRNASRMHAGTSADALVKDTLLMVSAAGKEAEFVKAVLCNPKANASGAMSSYYPMGIQGVVDGISIDNYLKATFLVHPDHEATKRLEESDSTGLDMDFDDAFNMEVGSGDEASITEEEEAVDASNLGLETSPISYQYTVVDDNEEGEALSGHMELATSESADSMTEWAYEGAGYRNAAALDAASRAMSRWTVEVTQQKVAQGAAYGPVTSFELSSDLAGPGSRGAALTRLATDMAQMYMVSPACVNSARTELLKNNLGKTMFFVKSMGTFLPFSPLSVSEALGKYRMSSASSMSGGERRKRDAYSTTSGTFFGL